MINIHLGDHTLSLGSFLTVFPAFSELGKLLGNDEKFWELMSVPGFFEQDVTEWWLGEVRKQAQLVLDDHRDDLEDETVDLLETLISESSFLSVKESADWNEDDHERAKDGKFPAGGGGGGEGKEAPSPAGKSKLKQMLSSTSHLATASKEVAKRVGDAAWGKMTPQQQKVASKIWAVGKFVEHQAMKGFSKGKEFVTKIAEEKGKTKEQVERTAKVIAFLDQAVAWTAAFPTVTAVTGNPALGKASSFIPMVSMGYVAFSTATNPLATYRAAKRMLTEKSDHHKKESDSRFSYTEDDVAALLEYLAGEGDPDLKMALVLGACDSADSLADAIKHAQSCLG